MFGSNRLHLVIDSRSFVAEFLNVLDIGAGIDERTAVGSGFAS